MSARDRHRKELDRQRRELCDDARDNLVPGLVAAAIGCRRAGRLLPDDWVPVFPQADDRSRRDILPITDEMCKRSGESCICVCTSR